MSNFVRIPSQILEAYPSPSFIPRNPLVPSLTPSAPVHLHTPLSIPHTPLSRPPTPLSRPHTPLSIHHTPLSRPHTLLSIPHTPISRPNAPIRIPHALTSIPHPPIVTSLQHNPVYTYPPSIPSPIRTPALIPTSSYTAPPQPSREFEIRTVQSLAPNADSSQTGISTVKKRKTIKLPRKKEDTTSKEYIISRLEKKLARYQASIEDAGNTELSLDDLKYEDNSLTRLSRLEKKASAIWEQICDMNRKSDRIMVVSELLTKVTCTPYPAINQRIERFFKRNTLDLPDIIDVSDMISKVSQKEGLSLGKVEMTRLSKQVLQYVGNLMSERRRADLYEVLKSRTENDELAIAPDPLLRDPVFKARLEENDASFKKQLNEALGHFCDQQDEVGVNEESAPEGDKFEDNSFYDLEDSPIFSPTILASDDTASFTKSVDCNIAKEPMTSPLLPEIKFITSSEHSDTDTHKYLPSNSNTFTYTSEGVCTTDRSAPKRINLLTTPAQSHTNSSNYVPSNSNTTRHKSGDPCTIYSSAPKKIKLDPNATIIISSDEEQ